MLAKTVLLCTPVRVFLGHARCYPAAGSLYIHSISRIRTSNIVSPFSSSCTLRDTPNKPGSSGDKGPAKNYRKKMRKKQKKVTALAEQDAMFEGMRKMDSLSSRADTSRTASLTSPKERVNDTKRKVTVYNASATESELDALMDGLEAIELLSTETQPTTHVVSPIASSASEEAKNRRMKAKKQRKMKGPETFTAPNLDAVMDELKTMESSTSEFQHTNDITSPLTSSQDHTRDKNANAMKRGEVVDKEIAIGSKLDALIDGIKEIESLTSEAQPGGHIASLMESFERRETPRFVGGTMFEAISEGETAIESLVTSKEQLAGDLEDVKPKKAAKFATSHTLDALEEGVKTIESLVAAKDSTEAKQESEALMEQEEKMAGYYE